MLYLYLYFCFIRLLMIVVNNFILLPPSTFSTNYGINCINSFNISTEYLRRLQGIVTRRNCSNTVFDFIASRTTPPCDTYDTQCLVNL